jgi:hypothetical protein
MHDTKISTKLAINLYTFVSIVLDIEQRTKPYQREVQTGPVARYRVPVNKFLR